MEWWSAGFRLDSWRLTTGELLFEQLEQVADGGVRFGVREGQFAVELELLLVAEPFLMSALPQGKRRVSLKMSDSLEFLMIGVGRRLGIHFWS